jgi:hypothetical protein
LNFKPVLDSLRTAAPLNETEYVGDDSFCVTTIFTAPLGDVTTLCGADAKETEIFNAVIAARTIDRKSFLKFIAGNCWEFAGNCWEALGIIKRRVTLA